MNKEVRKNKGINMEPWELLQKKMIWQQLSFIHNKKVLDFGSGLGITANYFAVDNEVIAIEPADNMINNRVVVKHNRNGRVMQNVVLLNNFEHAYELLDGKDGFAQNFGEIKYYDDEDIIKWSEVFYINKIHGIRTFWDLQQNQDIPKDVKWQEKMLAIETKVSHMDEFKAISSFHHIILEKKNINYI